MATAGKAVLADDPPRRGKDAQAVYTPPARRILIEKDMKMMREVEEIEELVERVIWFDIQNITYIGDMEEAADELIRRWECSNVVTGEILYKLHKFVLKLKYRLDTYDKLRPRYDRLRERIFAIAMVKELGTVIHKT